jgi:hypothetical protein
MSSSDLTATITQYLTAAPASLFAQQPVKVLDHWQGDENLLWHVVSNDHEAVLKLYLDAGQARSRRQSNGQKAFAPLGLAPEPLWVDRYPVGLARQLLVYTYVAGEQVKHEDRSELEAMAEAVARIHASPADAIGRFSPHPINLETHWRIEQSSVANVAVFLQIADLPIGGAFYQLATAAERLVVASLPLWAVAHPATVHGDLQLAHALISRGQVVLLDWELCGLGDPALDVARLLHREQQTLGAEGVMQWLVRYLAASDDLLIAERIEVYRKLLTFQAVIFLLNGLAANTRTGLSPELRAVLPDIGLSLAASLDAAATAFSVGLDDDATALVQPLLDWLVEKDRSAA